MKLTNEAQLLDIGFRQQVIAEIQGVENTARKNEARRRYEVYKDKTMKHVIESLKNDGLLPETIAAMTNRASNISICKKIINKLARTYSGGVIRTVGTNVEGAKAVDEMAKYLSFDDKMKKNDRYRELQKNAVAHFVQERSGGTEEAPLYRVGMRVLGPWEYDVIEDCYNREIPRVYILSDFFEEAAPEPTNEKDDVIADAPSDQGKGKKKRYIWWSDSYHFSTFEDGSYCEDLMDRDEAGSPDLTNPIEMLPFVNNAEEQDGRFWAEGGEDIADGAILTNKIITDMFYIMMLQGFGLLVVVGRNLKEHYKVGPNQAILLEQEEDGPAPSAQFANANPQLDMWMRAIEQYIAMLLTTNNLSVTHVAGKLDAVNFPSGIAAIIEMSEVTLETEDKYSQYAQQERDAFRIIQAWQAYLGATDEVDPAFKALPQLPPDIGTTLSTKFTSIKPVMTEGEKLANLKARKELGLNEEIDLIMLDNPDMDKEDAEAKLLRIKAAKLEAMATMAATMATAPGAQPKPGEEKKEDEEETASDDKKESGGGSDAPSDDKPKASEEDSLKSVALNGAQVTSMVGVVQAVAIGNLPRDSGVQILISAFAMSPEEAEEIMSSAGKTFKPANPEAAGAK